MEVCPLSPLLITGIRLDGATLVLDVAGTDDTAACSSCGEVARRIHDRYARSPRDLPWRGFAVRLAVTVRRFCCDNPHCGRKTFAEDFGAPLARRRRFTAAALGTLQAVAQTAGARPGAKLACRSGLPASHDTLLRLLYALDVPEAPTPRVLGVDDLALRRGTRYATIFVDLETHAVIDLVAGREAETLANWLRSRAGIRIVARDRAGAYADGARQGAPDALQIADRFHLVRNVCDAFAEFLQQQRWWAVPDGVLEPLAPSSASDGAAESPHADEVNTLPPVPVANPPVPAPRPLGPSQQHDAARRAARLARWRRVQELRAQGHSQRRIAALLQLNRRTVRRLLISAAPDERPQPGGVASPKLAPHAAYLQRRWAAGCTNVSQLFRELVALGYTGSRTLLNDALRPWRPPRLPKALRQKRNRRKLDRRRLRRLLTGPPERLDAEERAVLQRLLDADATVATGYALVQRFRQLLKERDAAGLAPWLADVRACGIPSLVAVTNGMLADHAAVVAAVTEKWSNGMVEGHVNRAKLQKRLGYGRASFALLRRRVLAA